MLEFITQVRSTLVGALLLLPTIATAHDGHTEAKPGTIRVASVVSSSPAAEAGMQVDDVFVHLDGQKIATHEDLKKVMAAHQPGDSVPLTVERDGETVNLTLKFGERPGGGVSIGVSLAIGIDPNAEPDEGTTQCLAWIEQTYRVKSMMRDLDLDLAADYEALLTCVGRDTRQLSTAKAVQYCDNIFKVHCSAVDLLAEIGETQVQRCEKLLGPALEPKQQKAWRTCGQHKIYDRYAMKGESSDEAACKAALDACLPQADPTIDPANEAGNEAGNEAASALVPGQDEMAWTQWGGPNQDFRARAGDLATSWPASGPERLWSRELGGGFSAILAEGERLYTMYRVGEEEAVVCLDAKTGETIWEHRYEHGPSPKQVRVYGEGPNSTPLIDGDLLFTIGIAGKMQALTKSDGEVLWSQELWNGDFGGNLLTHGYSSSPVAYQDTVIVPVGGEDAGLVAFDQASGDIRWKALSFRNSYSSPRIVNMVGEEQLVVFMAEELIGVNPANGELRWRYPHVNQWKNNTTMPTVADGRTIVLSSPQVGAKGLRLTLDGQTSAGDTLASNTIGVEEIWSTRRVQFYHGSSVQIGDWVYGSTGTATAFMTAINIRTGEVGWRERGFAKANCVGADGKLVILDEDGVLYLASATPERLIVHAKAQLLDRAAWTAPTIVGKTLYLRDARQIMAVDLG